MNLVYKLPVMPQCPHLVLEEQPVIKYLSTHTCLVCCLLQNKSNIVGTVFTNVYIHIYYINAA